MPLLLLVFLVLICLQEDGDWSPPLLGLSNAQGAALGGVIVLLVAALAWLLALWTRHALARMPLRRDSILSIYDRGQFFHRTFMLVGYLAALLVFGWGNFVFVHWQWPGRDGVVLPGADLLVLSPLFASVILSWACFYDADRAAHLSALIATNLDPFASSWLDARAEQQPTQLAPTVPFGGRAAYVLFHLRQRLGFLSIPLLSMILLKDARRLLPTPLGAWEPWFNGGAIVLLAVLLVSLPWVLRFAVGLRPFPLGPLRDRLEALARRLRFRCQLMIWPTRGGMVNAMLIGIMPWPRYVLFTDRMLETFSANEVEAVFGHEIGHGKHHHMLYYFLFLSGSLPLLYLAATLIGGVGDPSMAVAEPSEVAPAAAATWTAALTDGPPGEQQSRLLQILPMTAVMLAYVFVVFGFLSRRCERQSDLYGCRAVSCGDLECAGHAYRIAQGNNAVRSSALCPTGIRVFIRALEKVARLNGISRDQPGFLQSWQHGTIAQRVEFLDRVIAKPELERRFQRRLALLKWSLMVALAALLAGAAILWG